MKPQGKTYIVAEAGVNHNGKIALAKDLIYQAKNAGADAVKFQTFNTDKLVTKDAQQAPYQTSNLGKENSQYNMLKSLELSNDEFLELAKFAKQTKIEFLSTPFDNDSLDFLISNCKVKKIKIGSGDINNSPLLFKVGQTGLPIMISTGMSSLADIEYGLSVLACGYSGHRPLSYQECFEILSDQNVRSWLTANITILHCTSNYPTDYASVNLRNISMLAQTFGLEVGYSDHTQGIAIAPAAVAFGATVIEKHFTIDRDLPGPDHKASIMPSEFQSMVQQIRMVEQSLGKYTKQISQSELINRTAAKKVIVASVPIQKGEILSEKNISVKRSSSGISASFYWDHLGKSSQKNYSKDESIE